MTDEDILNRLEETTLASLLDARELSYMRHTHVILSKIREKLDTAVQMALNTSNVTWQTVERHPQIPNNVNVMGYNKVTVGTTIPINGEDVLITEENKNLYTNTVRFVIPISLLENGSAIQIYNFLRELTEISVMLTEKDLMDILNDPDFDGARSLYEYPKFANIMEKATRPKTFMDFSTDDLTEEQITALANNSHLVTGGKRH
jgi:hypothetical protein